MALEMTSAIPGFFKLSVDERRNKVATFSNLTEEDQKTFHSLDFCLNLGTCDTMIENFITRQITPVGVATNFIVDGVDRIIPYATEEPSVIAGASFAAKLARPCGGFTTIADPNVCTGQAVFLAPNSSPTNLKILEEHIDQIKEVANESMPGMVQRKGGTQSITLKEVNTESGNMLIIEIHVAVIDSMGANCVTKACESIKSYVQQEFGFEPLMGILTNLSTKRLVRAQGKWRISDLTCPGFDGFEVANKIIMAANLAKSEPYRAATHRKGIMNGISAVVLATGNDVRAVESAIHSYATLKDSNPALTNFWISNDILIGEIVIPIPVGTVGGSINRNESVRTFRKMMKVKTADDLARVIAAVGLAQNFAALRALVTQGISSGHMKLHSKNIACEAGAIGEEIDVVAEKLIQSGSITVTTAKKILEYLHCPIT